jgi:hypothetical protein
MQVKDLITALQGIDPNAQVFMTTFNDEGLEGNKVIDDANVFAIYEIGENGKEGIFHISNRMWDEGAS